MRRAVLLTGHFPRQNRRGSMLWVSDHLQAAGWHVTHATVGYSRIGNLMGDKRIAALGYRPKPGCHAISAHLTSVYHLPLLHPVRSRYRVVNALLDPLAPRFRRYWDPLLRQALRAADLVICESGAPVLLAPLLSRHAAKAARIYRVNDDIRLLNAPDAVLRAERQTPAHFTRVSTASPLLAARFAAHPNVTIDPMGVPHHLLRDPGPSPYIDRRARRHAVCAGTTQLDLAALERIARAKPAWRIDVLGRTGVMRPALPNLHFHGEVPFDRMLAFVAHADIGLAPYLDRPGVEYQSSNSNRVLLYRFYGLPILGPDRLCAGAGPSVFSYDQIDLCERAERCPEPVPDWSVLARRLVQNPEMDPPEETAVVPERVRWPRV